MSFIKSVFSDWVANYLMVVGFFNAVFAFVIALLSWLFLSSITVGWATLKFIEIFSLIIFNTWFYYRFYRDQPRSIVILAGFTIVTCLTWNYVFDMWPIWAYGDENGTRQTVLVIADHKDRTIKIERAIDKKTIYLDDSTYNLHTNLEIIDIAALSNIFGANFSPLRQLLPDSVSTVLARTQASIVVHVTYDSLNHESLTISKIDTDVKSQSKSTLYKCLLSEFDKSAPQELRNMINLLAAIQRFERLDMLGTQGLLTEELGQSEFITSSVFAGLTYWHFWNRAADLNLAWKPADRNRLEHLLIQYEQNEKRWKEKSVCSEWEVLLGLSGKIYSRYSDEQWPELGEALSNEDVIVEIINLLDTTQPSSDVQKQEDSLRGIPGEYFNLANISLHQGMLLYKESVQNLGSSRVEVGWPPDAFAAMSESLALFYKALEATSQQENTQIYEDILASIAFVCDNLAEALSSSTISRENSSFLDHIRCADFARKKLAERTKSQFYPFYLARHRQRPIYFEESSQSVLGIALVSLDKQVDGRSAKMEFSPSDMQMCEENSGNRAFTLAEPSLGYYQLRLTSKDICELFLQDGSPIPTWVRVSSLQSDFSDNYAISQNVHSALCVPSQEPMRISMADIEFLLKPQLSLTVESEAVSKVGAESDLSEMIVAMSFGCNEGNGFTNMSDIFASKQLQMRAVPCPIQDVGQEERRKEQENGGWGEMIWQGGQSRYVSTLNLDLTGSDEIYYRIDVSLTEKDPPQEANNVLYQAGVRLTLNLTRQEREFDREIIPVEALPAICLP